MPERTIDERVMELERRALQQECTLGPAIDMRLAGLEREVAELSRKLQLLQGAVVIDGNLYKDHEARLRRIEEAPEPLSTR